MNTLCILNLNQFFINICENKKSIWTKYLKYVYKYQYYKVCEISYLKKYKNV